MDKNKPVRMCVNIRIFVSGRSCRPVFCTRFYYLYSMRPIKYLVLILCLVCTQANAQEANPNKLLKTYRDTRLHDTLRLKALDQAASIFIYENPDTCLVIAKLMRNMAENTGQIKYVFIA